MEINFEFGFNKSNLIRRSFHGSALIEAYAVSSSRANYKERKPTIDPLAQEVGIFLGGGEDLFLRRPLCHL